MVLASVRRNGWNTALSERRESWNNHSQDSPRNICTGILQIKLPSRLPVVLSVGIRIDLDSWYNKFCVRFEVLRRGVFGWHTGQLCLVCDDDLWTKTLMFSDHLIIWLEGRCQWTEAIRCAVAAMGASVPNLQVVTNQRAAHTGRLPSITFRTHQSRIHMPNVITTSQRVVMLEWTEGQSFRSYKLSSSSSFSSFSLSCFIFLHFYFLSQ